MGEEVGVVSVSRVLLLPDKAIRRACMRILYVPTEASSFCGVRTSLESISFSSDLLLEIDCGCWNDGSVSLFFILFVLFLVFVFDFVESDVFGSCLTVTDEDVDDDEDDDDEVTPLLGRSIF